MMSRLTALLLRLLPRSLPARAALAFAVGFAATGLAIPQVRFLWVSFVHAGL